MAARWSARRLARPHRLGADQRVLILDGKSIRAMTEDGRCMPIWPTRPLGHEQCSPNAGDHKTNEVTAFAHALYVVQDKRADYLYCVKDNQPGLSMLTP